MKKKEKGITLIALLITVILLLILAGVTIRWVTTGDSIFKYADIAKKETKRGEIKEYLDVTLVDERTGGYKETVETIIKNTQKRVKENGKSDLSAVAKEVEVKDVETKKYNEKDAEYYFYVVVDEEVYKVGANGAEYLGQRANKEVVLQEGEISFDYSETKLTNENVKVTITTNTNIEGAKLYYKTAGEKGVAEEESNKWKEYNGKIEIEKNCSIVARLEGIMGDVTKEATGNVQNIDKLAPKTFTPSGSATTNTITVTAKTDDQEKTNDYATSGIAGYSFKIDEGEWTSYQEKGEYTFTELKQSTEHTIKVKAKDKAGNEMSTPAEITVNTEAMIATKEGEGGNILFSGLSSKWTNQDVTVTASPTSEYTKLGYKVQTSTDTKKWDDKAEQTLSANGNVYARIVDSTGQYAEGESWATANVTNIDKDNPNKPTVKLNLANNNNSYTSGTWTNQNVNVSFSATDNGGSGIASYEYSTDKTNNITSKTSPFTINAEGTTNIYVRAVDGATNRSAWSELKVVKKDTVAPTVNLKGTANGATNVTLNVSASEKQSKIYYAWTENDSLPGSWTEGTNGNYSGNKTITAVGKYYFWAKDEANNVVKSIADVTKLHTHSTSCYNQIAGYYQWYQTVPKEIDGQYDRYYYRCSACGAVITNGFDTYRGKYHCTQTGTTLICGQEENFGVTTTTEKVK